MQQGGAVNPVVLVAVLAMPLSAQTLAAQPGRGRRTKPECAFPSPGAYYVGAVYGTHAG